LKQRLSKQRRSWMV